MKRDRAYYREWRKKNREHYLAWARAYAKKRRQEQPERYRKYDRNMGLKRAYGLSLQQFETLYARQNGCCLICNGAMPSSGKLGAQVDHDHATGVIRGLLCPGCNAGLGCFREDVKHLMNAIAYLKRYQCRQVLA